jgi:hypothetical protein
VQSRPVILGATAKQHGGVRDKSTMRDNASPGIDRLCGGEHRRKFERRTLTCLQKYHVAGPSSGETAQLPSACGDGTEGNRSDGDCEDNASGWGHR